MFSKKKVIFISDSKIRDVHISGFSQFLVLLVFLALIGLMVWLPFKAGKLPDFSYNAEDGDLYNLLEKRLDVVEGDVSKLSKHILEIDKYKDYISTEKYERQLGDKEVSAPDAENLYDRIVKLEKMNAKLAYNVMSKANHDATILETVLTMIGHDYESIVGRKPPQGAEGDLGIGGPYEPVKSSELLKDEKEELVQNKIQYINDLKNIVYFLPLSQPMREAKRTSGFGVRRDPFKGTYAQHSGTDFVNHENPIIHATAPGKVVFAGYTTGYGYLIKIEHGYGFETRYAHLRQMNVEIGDTVDRGQEIGVMGSTGRSTGAHLHYEVRNNGIAYNPQHYLDAGEYVFFKQDNH